jgi:hypothetical protein
MTKQFIGMKNELSMLKSTILGNHCTPFNCFPLKTLEEFQLFDENMNSAPKRGEFVSYFIIYILLFENYVVDSI